MGLIFKIFNETFTLIDFGLKYRFCANLHKSSRLNPYLTYCQLTYPHVTVGRDYVRGAGAAERRVHEASASSTAS